MSISVDKQKVNSLLKSYEENRSELESKVKLLEELANKIDDLIPKEYTPRNRFVFEDKVKLLSMLFDTILKYRTELGKQIEKEIDIIQDILKEEAGDDLVTKVSAMPKQEAQELVAKLLHKLNEK